MLRDVPSERSEGPSSGTSSSESTNRISREAVGDLGSAAEELGLYLVVIEGRESGRWIRLGETPLAGGRDANLDLVFEEGEVSRLHVLVTVIDGTVVVEDLGSTNGTFVDGRRITRRASVPVGSVLRVGERGFRCARATRRDA